MFIDFTVENYRSIKEPVTLSAVAQAKTGRGNGDAKRKGIKPDDEIAPPFLTPNRKLELLPVLGIFGANASGKSNVVSALDDLLFLLIGSGASPVEYWRKPFLLDPLTSLNPSNFVLRTSHEAGIYTLSISLDDVRVLYERLDYVPVTSKRAVPKLIYSRTHDPVTEKYQWHRGPELPSGLRALENSLANSVPYASVLVTTLDIPQLRPWRDWITKRWPGISFDMEGSESIWVTDQILRKNRKELVKVVEFIRQFDTGLADIKIEVPTSHRKDDGSINVPTVWALHDGVEGLVRWAMKEESTGTQRLFVLAYKILRCFQDGSLLLIDELGSNIHPNITRAIVRLFQNPETNPRRAQLIFTSHDNTLQRGSLLRRDQIWFTQKRLNGSTDLYPLTDFHPRNDLALDRAYLDGRFGAVPLLPPDEELLAAPAGARGVD